MTRTAASTRNSNTGLQVQRYLSLGLAASVLACAPGDVKAGLGPNEPEAAVVVLAPTQDSIVVGQVVLIAASARTSTGQPAPAEIDWSADGGTLTTLTDSTAQFSAANAGSYTVRGRGRKAPHPKDSTIIVVDPPVSPVVSIAVAPGSVTLGVDGVQAFVVTATRQDGTTMTPAVTWSATGGTIDAAGIYRAGNTAGTYRVIAKQQGGALADTAVVTLTAAPPVLQAVNLSPSSASLTTGGTQQFNVSGQWSDGSTTAPSVTYSATGGTISSGGLYTAGNTAGTFRVIAKQLGGSLADTAAVTLTAAPPVLQAVILTPSSASLTTGGTQQFSVSGQWSNGSTAAPNVTYTATGGTISSGGLYTAGNTAGTFRVIAKQQGGSLADTSIVTIVTATGGVIFAEDFESGLGKWEDVTRLQTGTAQAHSGTHALEINYAAGVSDPGWIWRKHLVPDQATQHDQYVRWWQRWSPGFTFYNGSGSDQKLIMLEGLSPQDGWAQTASWKIYLHVVGQSVSGVGPTTLYPERFIWDGSSQWSGQWQGFRPTTPSAYVADRWICTEVEVKHNTPGQADGEFRVWIDGALMTQNTAVKFRDNPISWNAIEVTGYYDGGSPKAQASWVDDIVVSTQRIGC